MQVFFQTNVKSFLCFCHLICNYMQELSGKKGFMCTSRVSPRPCDTTNYVLEGH